MFKRIVLISFVLLLAGCGQKTIQDGPPKYHVDLSHVKNATPKHEPKSKYGNMKSYTVFGKQYTTMDNSHGYREKGIASWYGTKFHNRLTSSREPYDMFAMTAAHKSLPLPTYVLVRNLKNNKEVVVKVNDRGPFAEGRIIDLSYAAAVKLGVVKTGTAPVEVIAVHPEKKQPFSAPIVPDNYYLQLGAFSSNANAKKFVKQLKTPHQKSRIHIKKSYIHGRTLYLVRIGPFDTKTAATQASSHLGVRDSQLIKG